MLSEQLREQIELIIEAKDIYTTSCEKKLDFGKTNVWVSGIRPGSIGRKAFKLCVINQKLKQNLPRSEQVKLAQQKNILEGQIKILMAKLATRDKLNVYHDIQTYLNKI